MKNIFGNFSSRFISFLYEVESGECQIESMAAHLLQVITEDFNQEHIHALVSIFETHEQQSIARDILKHAYHKTHVSTFDLLDFDLDNGRTIKRWDRPISYNQDLALPRTRSEREIIAAIRATLDATDSEGNRLFTGKMCWYAMFCTLKEYCNYPRKMTDFVAKMNNLGFDGSDGLSYESLRKAPNSVPRLARLKPEAWDTVCNLSPHYAQQYEVANFLMLQLGIKA